MDLYYIYSNNSKLDNFDSKSSVMRPHDRNSQQDISSFIVHNDLNEIIFNS